VCAAGDLLRKRCLPGSRLPARWIEFAWPRRALQLLQSAIQIPLIIMPGTTQAGANRIVVFQSGRRDTWPYAPSRKWRERDASFRTGHSTNRAGSFLLPRAPVPCRRTCRGTRGNSSIHGYKKEKGKGRSQANTGGGKRRVGKKTDVTVSANQPLPVFALPTGDDHHSQLKRTDQEST
jgi:hypothetical protein